MDKEEDEVHRNETDPDIRVIPANHWLDPGFINERKIFSIFGEPLVSTYQRLSDKTGVYPAQLVNGHLITELCIKALQASQTATLSELIHRGPITGMVFCSTELLGPASNDIMDLSQPRTRNQILNSCLSEYTAYLDYSKNRIVADTPRGELQDGDLLYTIVGEIRKIEEKVITIHPILMGAPTFRVQSKELNETLMWHGRTHYKIYPEDIDEFCKLKTISTPDVSVWMPVMKQLSEEQIKTKLAEILGEQTKKDWGGELHDHYSSHLHLRGERKSGAFMLKGPGNQFKEMNLVDHAGKNGDQFFRLQQSPAEVLIVQHCHNIAEPVEATLRAFAVSPQNPRFYCLINGRDTYRILKAYGKI